MNYKRFCLCVESEGQTSIDYLTNAESSYGQFTTVPSSVRRVKSKYQIKHRYSLSLRLILDLRESYIILKIGTK